MRFRKESKRIMGLQIPLKETPPLAEGEKLRLEDVEKQNVQTWAGFGFTDEAIAVQLKTTVEQLRSALGEEIDQARLKAEPGGAGCASDNGEIG